MRVSLKPSSRLMEERNLLVEEAANLLASVDGVADEEGAHKLAQEGFVRFMRRGRDRRGRCGSGREVCL